MAWINQMESFINHHKLKYFELNGGVWCVGLFALVSALVLSFNSALFVNVRWEEVWSFLEAIWEMITTNQATIKLQIAPSIFTTASDFGKRVQHSKRRHGWEVLIKPAFTAAIGARREVNQRAVSPSGFWKLWRHMLFWCKITSIYRLRLWRSHKISIYNYLKRRRKPQNVLLASTARQKSAMLQIPN